MDREQFNKRGKTFVSTEETKPSTTTRRFYLERKRDVTGISGTGRVAEGVEFEDGTVVIRWAGKAQSTVVWNNIVDAVKVHGHGNSTIVVWVD